MMGFIYYAIVV